MAHTPSFFICVHLRPPLKSASNLPSLPPPHRSRRGDVASMLWQSRVGSLGKEVITQIQEDPRRCTQIKTG